MLCSPVTFVPYDSEFVHEVGGNLQGSGLGEEMIKEEHNFQEVIRQELCSIEKDNHVSYQIVYVH